MKTIVMAVFILAVSLLTGCGKQEVNGEVFVVTQSAGNVKLGLVTVSFLTDEQYKIATDSNTASYRQLLYTYKTLDSVIVFNNTRDFKENLRLYAIDTEYAQIYLKRGSYGAYASGLNDAAEEKKQANKCLEILSQYKSFSANNQVNVLVVRQFIDGLKDKIVHDKTDADGKFMVELSKKIYHVYASATRQVAEKKESYYWNFEYTPDGKKLFLSNDNLYPVPE